MLINVIASFLQAILPYSQALEKIAPHIQQVSMESNGKSVSIDGVPIPYVTVEIDFGEPGTTSQHSFYQLTHQNFQGRVIPCDFIGVVKSQQPVYLKGEVVSNHDELMSNFFAQPNTLAYGKFLVDTTRVAELECSPSSYPSQGEGVGQVFLVWNTNDTRGNIKRGAWEEGIFKGIWDQPKTLFLRLWFKWCSTTRSGDAKTLDPRWRLLLA